MDTFIPILMALGGLSLAIALAAISSILIFFACIGTFQLGLRLFKRLGFKL